MNHIQLRDAETGKRILPAYYSDNYVSLLPGEEWTITVEAASKELHGDQPLIWLDGWNVAGRPNRS
jgi:mannosylglycoprotein endo-beta-mannosidase